MTSEGYCRRMTVTWRVSAATAAQSIVRPNNIFKFNKLRRFNPVACLGLASASRLGVTNARKQKNMPFQQYVTPRPVRQALGFAFIFCVLRKRKRGCAAVIVQRFAGALLFCLGTMLSPSLAGASDIKAGQSVYEAHCISCHGPEGTPTMPGTPDLSTGEGLDAPDLDLARRIKQGKNLMPAYEALIKDDDILNVIAYIRTLRR